MLLPSKETVKEEVKTPSEAKPIKEEAEAESAEEDLDKR